MDCAELAGKSKIRIKIEQISSSKKNSQIFFKNSHVFEEIDQEQLCTLLQCHYGLLFPSKSHRSIFHADFSDLVIIIFNG